MVRSYADDWLDHGIVASLCQRVSVLIQESNKWMDTNIQVRHEKQSGRNTHIANNNQDKAPLPNNLQQRLVEMFLVENNKWTSENQETNIMTIYHIAKTPAHASLQVSHLKNVSDPETYKYDLGNT